MTTTRQVTIMSAAWILRGLRAEGNIPSMLNRTADLIVGAVVKDDLKTLVSVKRMLRNLRDGLEATNVLDNLILAQALNGVLELLMTKE